MNKHEMSVRLGSTAVGISLICTSSVSAATIPPTLAQIVQNSYLARYQQSKTTTLQTATFGNQTSTLSGRSTMNSEVNNNSLTQRGDMTTSVYGSPWHQSVYLSNGLTYFNTGHGWMGPTKNPATVDWPKAVTKMSGDWKQRIVVASSGGRQIKATSVQHTAHQLLDPAIYQVLLRSNLQLLATYANFNAWLIEHYPETTVIGTETIAGQERMKFMETTLTVHMTADEVRQFWGAKTSTTSKADHKTDVSSEFYPLTATYHTVSNFTYRTNQVNAPLKLSSIDPHKGR